MTVAEVFIDADLAAQNGGEEGAALASGVRVGPNTLAEILCGGKVRVITTNGLHPIASTDRTDTIPPVIRRFVTWRDLGQCSITGCSSRYRIQPHHITERHRGGTHDPENLIAVCWYHHHIAIHQLGYHHRPRIAPAPETTPLPAPDKRPAAPVERSNTSQPQQPQPPDPPGSQPSRHVSTAGSPTDITECPTHRPLGRGCAE